MQRVHRTGQRSVAAVCAALLLVAGCGTSGKDDASSTTGSKTTRSTSSASTTSIPEDSAAAGPWVAVSDAPSGLSFRMPRKPKLLASTVAAPKGGRIKTRGYQVVTDTNLLVQVSVYDLAGRSFDAEKAIAGVAAAASGRVSARTHTASGGLDIVDAKVHIPKGPALGYDRVFKIGDYAVQLYTVGLVNNEAEIRFVQQRLSSTFKSR